MNAGRRQRYLIHETNEEERLGQTRLSRGAGEVLVFGPFDVVDLSNEWMCLVEDHDSLSLSLLVVHYLLGADICMLLRTLRVRFAYESVHVYGRLKSARE